MAKKRKVAVKKPAKPAAATMRAHRKPTKTKPPPGGLPGNSRQPKFATFEEAKTAAVDALIQVIEEAERQLTAAKRAQSFKDLP